MFGTTRKVNHDAFDGLSREALYWCGILASDGCVYNSRGRAVVAYSSVDVEHVLKFKAFLGAEHRVIIKEAHGFANGRPQAVLSFTSWKIVAFLISHGIVPNKSLTLQVSDVLASSSDFWRGMIDGDGSIHPVGGVTLGSGSLGLLQQYVDFFCSKFPGAGAPKIKVRLGDKNPMYSVTLSRFPGRELLKILYAETGAVSLDRKRLIVEELIRGPQVRKSNRTLIFLPPRENLG